MNNAPCPCCGHELTIDHDPRFSQYNAWCGFGPCRSTKANDGAFGGSPDEACANLVKLLDESPDWSDAPTEEPDAAAIDAADHKYQMQKDDK